MSTRYSDHYQFTVEKHSILGFDLAAIDELRKQAKIMNLNERIKEVKSEVPYNTRYRVIVRGRLGKNNSDAPLYAVGGPLHTYSAQDIKLEHATRADVYLRPVRIWNGR